MEELEDLDEKALTEAYIASYSYTTTQKVVGCFIALVALSCIILAGSFIVINVIGLLIK